MKKDTNKGGKIYSQDIGVESDKKCAILIMRSRIELSNQEQSERSEKNIFTNTWKYQKQRWNKKI